MPQVYEDLLKNLHKGNTSGTVDVATLMDVAEQLMEAIFTGYGKDFEGMSFDAPNYDMLARLERDVYAFSYAKNHQMLKALTLALKDGNRLRTYSEFRQEAATILDEWVGNWLRTEYDTAIASAQMAARWVEFQRDADIVPLLEYHTAGDERVRDAHRVLHGVIKPINDKFWNTYYPPNGWGCRCDVLQLNRGTVTPDESIVLPDDMPKLFKTNLAKHGLAFPPGHPYYKGIPKDELSRYVLNLPADRQFEVTYRNGGGVVRQHMLVDKEAKDFATVHQVAFDKADKGHMVEIMPVIHINDAEARKKIFPGVMGNKNPDLRIDGQYTEVERPETSKKAAISRRIRLGARQANNVIISLPEAADEAMLRDVAKGRFNTNPDIEQVEYEWNGIYTAYRRGDFP